MKYPVQMSDRMLVALVDIDENYDKDDSPRWHGSTLGALLRRELCDQSGRRLNKKGKAYLEMALFHYAASKEVVKESNRARTGAAKAKLKAVGS